MSKPDQIRSAVLAELARQGMSRAELARRVKWNPSHLGEWLNGTRDPRVATVEKVLAALGLSIKSHSQH